MNAQRKRSSLLIASALGFSLALSAQAAGTNDASSGAQGKAAPSAANAPRTSMATTGTEIRASKLIGKNIENAQGENLGEIKDLVVDTTNGKVQYAVVSFGGALGLGKKLFAYPIEQFGFGTDRDKLVLNVDKERMKSAPGFDDKQWPDFNKSDYRAQVDRHYRGTAPNVASGGTGNDVRTAPTVRFARASKLLDADLKDRNNKDIGDVEDMVVDVKSGKVRYVVAEFDPSWVPGNARLVAMPMRAFKAEGGDQDDLVYSAGRDELQKAPTFDRGRWPDVASDATFRADVDRYDQTWLNRPDTVGQTTRR